MNDVTLLIATLGVLQLLFAAGWWLAAGRLPTERLAARHWSGFSLCSGLAMLGFVESLASWLGPALPVLRNAAVMLAFVILRRGMLAFLRQPLHDRQHLAVLIAYAGLMAWAGAGQEAVAGRTVVLSALVGVLLLAGGSELPRFGGREFGRVQTLVVGLPMALTGLAMIVRAALSLWQPESGAASLERSGTFNALLVSLLVVMLPMFYFALGYLVMIRMVAELQHLSTHDSLTRLLNRRAFEQRLQQELSACARTGLPMGLLMVDVDHFKRINDRHGHLAGDQALQAVAQRLAGAARAHDVVARLGGEEFGVLLPATDAAGIRQAAERLRQAVSAQPLTLGTEHAALAVSIGASMRLTEHDDAEALLRRADQGLYRAKAEGRDRVIFDTLAQVAESAPPATSRPAELV